MTDRLLPELRAWRERDPEAIYPIVWLNTIHYKIRELNIEGRKELLGLYLSDQERGNPPKKQAMSKVEFSRKLNAGDSA